MREEGERGKGGISSAPLCDWKFNRGSEIEGEREGRRERWMDGRGEERERGERERERERGRGGGGERKREAKGTETSLLCSFQQKLVVVNNAHYGIHRGGGGEGREGDEGGRELEVEGEVYISWGSF